MYVHLSTSVYFLAYFSVNIKIKTALWLQVLHRWRPAAGDDVRPHAGALWGGGDRPGPREDREHRRSAGSAERGASPAARAQGGGAVRPARFRHAPRALRERPAPAPGCPVRRWSDPQQQQRRWKLLFGSETRAGGPPVQRARRRSCVSSFRAGESGLEQLALQFIVAIMQA